MTENSRTRRRHPWWVFGSNLVTAVVLTLIFGFMLVRSGIALAEGGSGWDVAFLCVLAPVVLSGIASVVHFARLPETENPFIQP